MNINHYKKHMILFKQYVKKEKFPKLLSKERLIILKQ